MNPPSAGPQALGQALDPAVARAAAGWFSTLRSGEATPDERERWRRWHDAHPDHARAWRHLESLTGALSRSQGGDAARQGLLASQRARSQRRQLLGIAALLGSAGGAGWLATEFRAGGLLQHTDYATATGARRRFVLPDGSEVLLGTASKASLHYSEHERRVRLISGEALFVTAHALHPEAPADARPFIVETRDGRVRALGTRFTVRQDEDHSRAAVTESAVEITPAGGGAPVRVRAGQAANFRAAAVDPVTASSDTDTAWSRGLLVVDNQRLDHFLRELNRYRPGWLRADPAVAGLRFSAVFPLNEPANTGPILAMLPNSLPVQVRFRTPWWVTVEPD